VGCVRTFVVSQWLEHANRGRDDLNLIDRALSLAQTELSQNVEVPPRGHAASHVAPRTTLVVASMVSSLLSVLSKQKRTHDSLSWFVDNTAALVRGVLLSASDSSSVSTVDALSRGAAGSLVGGIAHFLLTAPNVSPTPANAWIRQQLLFHNTNPTETIGRFSALDVECGCLVAVVQSCQSLQKVAKGAVWAEVAEIIASLLGSNAVTEGVLALVLTTIEMLRGSMGSESVAAHVSALFQFAQQDPSLFTIFLRVLEVVVSDSASQLGPLLPLCHQFLVEHAWPAALQQGLAATDEFLALIDVASSCLENNRGFLEAPVCEDLVSILVTAVGSSDVTATGHVVDALLRQRGALSIFQSYQFVWSERGFRGVLVATIVEMLVARTHMLLQDQLVALLFFAHQSATGSLDTLWSRQGELGKRLAVLPVLWSEERLDGAVAESADHPSFSQLVVEALGDIEFASRRVSLVPEQQ
jgi:hypothetical protein